MASVTQFFGDYIRPKIKRKAQQVRYLLSDRSDLNRVTPRPKPLGYDRIYHYHIRKTAGSSLNTAFKNAFRDPAAGMADEEALFARYWGVIAGKVYVTHSEYLLERGNFFYGDGHGAFHELIIPENTFKVTILRDPAARVLSYYRMLMHWKNNDIKHPARKTEEAYVGNSFAEFLERVPREHLMRQLYMFSKTFDVSEAAKNIATLNFVMTTEDYCLHLGELSALLNIDLRLYRQKSNYGAVMISESDRARLVEVLAPEYALLEAVAPLIGVHQNRVRPVEAPVPSALGAALPA